MTTSSLSEYSGIPCSLAGCSSRVADLQSDIDATMAAFDVVEKSKAKLGDSTLSLRWDVFGCPQKVQLPQLWFRRALTSPGTQSLR